MNKFLIIGLCSIIFCPRLYATNSELLLESANISHWDKYSKDILEWDDYICRGGRKPNSYAKTLISSTNEETAKNKPVVSCEVEGRKKNVLFDKSEDGQQGGRNPRQLGPHRFKDGLEFGANDQGEKSNGAYGDGKQYSGINNTGNNG